MKICQNCKEYNSDSMSFCVECGTPLPSVAGSTPIPGSQSAPTVFSREQETMVARRGTNAQQFYQAPKKSNIGKILLIGFAVLFVLGIGVAGIGAVIFISTLPTEQNKITTLKDTPAPAPSFTPPSQPTRSGSFTVRADRDWQLSDLDTVPLENFKTGIKGTVDIAGVKNGIGPQGINDEKTASRRLYPEFPTGALLMRTRYADGKFSNVVAMAASGATGDWQNYPDERGKIEFCINDNAPERNTGQFTVTKTLVNIAKPAKK
jgi:hypothetical protein